MRKLIRILVIGILLTSLLCIAFRVEKVQASGTIYIRADGSIDPPTANISTADNVTYTFLDNNYDSIVVERDNIVIDGASYTLQGAGSGNGIFLSGRSNVTLRDIEIKAFSCGVGLNFSSSNVVSGNNISNNEVSIGFSFSSSNTISENNITNNWRGVYLGDSSDNIIYHNNFVDNTQQTYIMVGSTNVWDNGCEGNFWSNYAGSDSDGDGIGDTPYMLDGSNQDQYPLMNPYWTPGDIDHDLDVDIYDIVKAAGIYGSTLLDPEWNPHCDIAEPYGIIDIFDLVMIAGNYGEEYLA